MTEQRVRHRIFESGPPYSVQRYFTLRCFGLPVQGEDNGEIYQDAARFLCLDEYPQPALPSGFKTTPVARVWHNRWKHVGGRMAGGVDGTSDGPLDSPYVRAWEEVPYVRELVRLLESMRAPEWGDRALRVGECMLWPGRFEHLYYQNKTQWGEDLWNESRLRSRPPPARPGQRPSRHVPVFFGWHMVEYHNMANEDRRRLYLSVPQWWLDDFSAARVLGVPTPWILVYAQTYLHLARSLIQTNIYHVATVEYTIGFVMNHMQAAYLGVSPESNATSDYRIHGGHGGTRFRGRLFTIPPGVVETLSRLHPFYIIESSGYDPVRAFLALRRAQEVSISSQICCQYRWDTGHVQGFTSIRTPTKKGAEMFHDEVRVENRLDVRTSYGEASAAWTKFQELTAGHRGRRARVQVHDMVTQHMNEQGWGIESIELTELRTRDDSGAWVPVAQPYNDEVHTELDDFARRVRAMPAQEADGGLSHVIGQPHQQTHEDEDDVDGQPMYVDITHPAGAIPTQEEVDAALQSTAPPREAWWPESETNAETKTRLDAFSNRCTALGMDVPMTLGTALTTACTVADELLDRRGGLGREEADRVRAARSAAETALAAKTTECTGAQEEADSLRGDLRNAERRVVSLTTRLESVTATAATVPGLQNRLTAATALTERQAHSLQTHTAHHEQMYGSVRRILEGVKNRADNLKTNYDALKAVTDDLVAAHAEAEGASSSTTRTRGRGIFQRMRELATQLQATHRADHDRLDEAFAATRDVVGDEAGSPSTVDRAQLRTEVEHLRTALGNAERERDEERTKVAATEEDLEAARASLSEQEEATTAATARAEAHVTVGTQQRARAERLFNVCNELLATARADQARWSSNGTTAIATANEVADGSLDTEDSDAPLSRRARKRPRNQR